MATFTATANSNSTIGYAQYGSTTWNRGTTNGACQGAYQGTSASRSRVGVMVFSGAGAALKGKIITQITLRITCSAAGSGSSSKKLSFRRANYQTLQTGITGSAQVGAALGTLTGKFYNNTVTHTLSATSNAALFEAMKTTLPRAIRRWCSTTARRPQQRLFEQLRARDDLRAHRDLHGRHGLVPRREHMEAMHGLVPQRRRMGAGRAVLPQWRDVDSRLTATSTNCHLPAGRWFFDTNRRRFSYEGLFH